MFPQAFLLQTRGIAMKLKVYRPEEILVTLVVEYDEIIGAFASIPKFIGYDERLVLDVRFNTRTSDIEILATRTEWFAEGQESFVSRNIPVSGDIQGTFLQPLASRLAEGISESLLTRGTTVIC
jgi:hypothetical protein